MSGSVLQRVAASGRMLVCCSVLQCVAVCCSVLQNAVVCDTTYSSDNITHTYNCGVLCVAECCSCSELWYVTRRIQMTTQSILTIAVCCVLQCVAVCCSMGHDVFLRI